MPTNDELCESAQQAIDRLWGDTSVSREQTKSKLEDLLGHIQGILYAMDEEEEGD